MGKPRGCHDLTFPEPMPERNRQRWLYRSLQSAILEGRLRPLERLPSTRRFASQYGLARGTVAAVYEQLMAEGYVRSRVGAGTFVADTVPEYWLKAESNPSSRSNVSQGSVSGVLSTRGQALARTPFPVEPAKDARPFTAHLPALDAFPLRLWSRLAARRLRHGASALVRGGDALGYRPLREAIAAYLGTARGVMCVAEQILITVSTQQSLDLCARLLLDAGDPVWVEDPCYPGTRHILEAAGAALVPVAVDGEGLDVAAAERRSPHARLACVTAAHQAPLGVALSLPRRMALLAWARRAGAWIFEDDYDSEFRYVGKPLAALQSLDEDGTVLHAGCFSMTLFPALRIGYLVLPHGLVDAFAAARSLTSRYVPTLEQAVLCDFIVEGHFARHVRRMRELYAERRLTLEGAVHAELAGLVEVPPISAGLETVAWLAPCLGEAGALAAAKSAGIVVRPLSDHVLECLSTTLRFPASPRAHEFPAGFVPGVSLFPGAATTQGPGP